MGVVRELLFVIGWDFVIQSVNAEHMVVFQSQHVLTGLWTADFAHTLGGTLDKDVTARLAKRPDDDARPPKL
jgi:hypothetical protein